jgi:hypothetical protein
MKYIVVLLLMTILSCNSQDKTNNCDLEIEIINTEFISRSNLNEDSAHNFSSFKNFAYDSLPVNKINFKIKNNGTKKYVFFIKKELDDLWRGNSELRIYKDKIKIEPTYLGWAIQHSMKHISMKKFMVEMKTDSLKYEMSNTYLKEKVSIDKLSFYREMSYIVIHPGETKYFTYYRTLPVYTQNFDSHYMYFLNPNEKYYCELSLYNDSEALKKYLTINQSKEINDNNYVLFNGVIKSNRIPIKFVDF